MKCNCMGCVKRHLGCHDSCPDYKAFREGVETQRKAERELVQKELYGRRLYHGRPRKGR